VASQLDNARGVLQRHDPRCQDVALLAHATVGDAAGSASASGHQPSDGCGALGGGMHAQFEAAGAGGSVDVRELAPAWTRTVPGLCHSILLSNAVASTTPPSSGTHCP